MDRVVFWSNIRRSIIDSSLGQYDLRKLLFGDFDVGIAVISLEEVVIFWLMLFDHVVFQIQCFALILDSEKVEFSRFGEHFLFSERVGREILSESLLEIFGFADIENSVFPILE